MSFCDDPTLGKTKKRKFRQAPKSSGLNAGHRTRTQPKVVIQESSWTVLQPEDLAHPQQPVLTSVPSKHQIMHDTHGFIQNWYNPCCHEKYDGESYSIPSISDEDGVIISFENSPGFMEVLRATLPFLPPDELDELALKSEQKLKNIVTPGLDLFNFIREIIAFVNGNISIVRRFQSLYERMMIAFQKAYKRFRDQGHKEVAAYWLAWNFAIKPFLGDLKALLCAANHLHKQMAWLRRTNGRVFYRTYTRDFNLPVDDTWHNGLNLVNVNKADPGEMANGAYTQQLQYFQVTLKYVARGKFILSLPTHLLDEASNGMGALWAAYNGLTNPVGVIWEMIPFSWLLDYFLSFRSRLFQTMYDANPFNSGVRVLGYGHSFKWDAITVGRIARITSDVTTVHANAGRVDYRLYRRESGLPYSGQATYFRIPHSWYQLSIIGAIEVGHLPKRRRRRSR